MRLLTAVIMAFICSLMACSIPDDGSLDDFTRKIREMDPTAGKAARLAEARQRTKDALRERSPGDTVGRVECRDRNGHGYEQIVTVEQILECLSVTSQLTFALCVESRIADIESDFRSGGAFEGGGCKYKEAFDFSVDPKWDPDQITEDDLARSAIASPSRPPAWMFAAGIVAIGAGGVFIFASGWGAVLCTLDISYGCPGDPLAPGDSPDPAGSSGGDQ